MARALVKLPDLIAEEAHRAEELPINVELALLPGAVADAHRSAGPPSGQVAERALAEVVLAADSEHDLHANTSLHLCCHCIGHPVEEARRLNGTGANPKRLQGQAGVVHPGVAIVPIALSSDRLGQRGGRCGDNGSGGTEHEGLQHTTALVNQLPPGSRVRLVQI